MIELNKETLLSFNTPCILKKIYKTEDVFAKTEMNNG